MDTREDQTSGGDDRAPTEALAAHGVVRRIFSDLNAGGHIRFEGRHIHILRTLPKDW